MSLAPPWLLVFDLDGTLIDSSLDLCLSVNAALEHVGAPRLPHERIASYIGDGAATLVRRALTSAEVQTDSTQREPREDSRFDQAHQFFLDYYRRHKLDNTRVYEGVMPSLRAIRRAQPLLPMAVLTNKPVNPSREICAALDLAPFFFANYGGNSFASKKPDPLGLLALMDEARQVLGATQDDLGRYPAERVVMIGDSETDILTARNAGAFSLGCRYGLSPASLERSAPDLVCDMPEEWPVLLNLEHLVRN